MRHAAEHEARAPASRADAWPSVAAVPVIRTAAPGDGEHGRYRHGGRTLEVREALQQQRALLEELADDP
jgi:hypothetical protein